MRFRLFALGYGTGLAGLLLGCDPAGPAAPLAAPLGASAPVDVPLLEVIEDINACTGEQITLTYSATARVQDFGDHFVLQARGTVATSDGWSGTFTWSFVFQDDHIAHIAAHDMEITDGSHQRMIFPLGLEQHVSSTDGELIVDFVHFSKDRVRCVGKPA
jgi:hypothetical protein